MKFQNQKIYLLDTLIPKSYFYIIKINGLIGELNDMSSKSHALIAQRCACLQDRNAGVARAAVQALGHVVLTLSSTAGLIEELLALLGCGDANVVSEVRAT